MDSAIKFETLKPRLHSLQKHSEHLKEQLKALEKEVKFISDSHELDLAAFAIERKKQKRKRRNAFLIGMAAGIVIGSLTN